MQRSRSPPCPRSTQDRVCDRMTTLRRRWPESRRAAATSSYTPRGPGTLPFPFGERHRAHPHTTGGASLLCLSLHRILGGQSFSPPLSGRVPYPCVCCFLMPTATAGCSCLWREYAADAVECVPVSKVDKLKMPRRCQPVNLAVPNVSFSSPPFKPCVRCCD